jgi:hypothetical protein
VSVVTLNIEQQPATSYFWPELKSKSAQSNNKPQNRCCALSFQWKAAPFSLTSTFDIRHSLFDIFFESFDIRYSLFDIFFADSPEAPPRLSIFEGSKARSVS